MLPPGGTLRGQVDDGVKSEQGSRFLPALLVSTSGDLCEYINS